MAEKEKESLLNHPDFSQLKGKDEYALYFNHIFRLCSMLIACYANAQGGFDTSVIKGFLEKFLYSVQALRKKYLYDIHHSLRVDLTDSGFPNFLEFNYLAADLLRRNAKLMSFPDMQALKSEMLDYMFTHRSDSAKYLLDISTREYFQELKSDKLFLTFTPGAFVKNTAVERSKKEMRRYSYSWASYDPRTNRPYIYIMEFEQDGKSSPLEEKGSNYTQFIQVVGGEGSYAFDIGIIAMNIDRALNDIHPKVLKRLCIGPVCTVDFSRDPKDISDILTRHGVKDDFVLFFDMEVVYSEAQVKSTHVFSLGQLREIFYIPEADSELYERKASMIQHYMLLPHAFLQQMDEQSERARYAGYKKITYDAKGGVYVS